METVNDKLKALLVLVEKHETEAAYIKEQIKCILDPSSVHQEVDPTSEYKTFREIYDENIKAMDTFIIKGSKGCTKKQAKSDLISQLSKYARLDDIDMIHHVRGLRDGNAIFVYDEKWILETFMPAINLRTTVLTRYRPIIGKMQRLEDVGFVLAGEAKAILIERHPEIGNLINYHVGCLLRCNSKEATSQFALYKKGETGTKYSIPLVHFIRDNFNLCAKKYNKLAAYKKWELVKEI